MLKPFILICVILQVAFCAYAEEASHSLAEMSVEQLINLTITSVSKREQALTEAAAAVHVITQEDIRRSGATSVPELLRMAPGLDVARVSGNSWAVSARGFNRFFSNKLLVLIDGRSVYNPLFAGVHWDAPDTLLEDIDRIEVIRGPGATLWGTNAVNGVINIITKKASDTKGILAAVGGGTKEQEFAQARYGAPIGENGDYRVYLKYFERDNFEHTAGGSANDEWRSIRAGFRSDLNSSANDTVTVQGDSYYSEEGIDFIIPALSPPFSEIVPVDRYINGTNVLGRWKHLIDSSSELQLQAYYDLVNRHEGLLDQNRNTFDLDLQHRFALTPHHEVIWGLGFRFYRDDSDGTFTISFDPETRNVEHYTAFVQDEITLVENELRLIVGSKFEHTEFTGFEFQPNVRMLFTPDQEKTFWGAISRAARTPSRAAHDSRVNLAAFGGPGGVPNVLTSFGNGDYESENLIAYELGYRQQLSKRLFFDIALFYNRYYELQTLEPGVSFTEASPSPFHSITPLFIDNRAQGETYGIEVDVDWRLLDWLRIVPSYSFLDINITRDNNSFDVLAERAEDESPHHQAMLRSLMELSEDWQLDSALRYVDNLSALNIQSYLELDLRLAWHATKNLELSLVGQNLLDGEHTEYVAKDFISLTPIEIPRSVYGKVLWTF